MRYLLPFPVSGLLLVAVVALAASPPPPPPRVMAADAAAARVVVVLANGADPESVSLAKHYAEARQVPEENIIALPMPLKETISWREFIDAIYNPLQAELVKREWIDAITAGDTDSIGRTKYAISGHRIRALVVCRGVPLRMNGDAKLVLETPGRGGQAAASGAFSTNAGAVDSELALLAASGYQIAGLLPNPLYNVKAPSDQQRIMVVTVGRLDGITPQDARALVDNALRAEREGLIGRAYVDIGGPHKQGDVWMEAAVKEIESLGFDLAVDRERGRFGAASRFDAPALYFGWYTGAIDGPFLTPGFRFPPGAVALHIYSFSASSMRNAKGWTPGFVARGVTATVGNVHEPYLQFTHQPHLLIEALARGEMLGDAALYALNGLSWQAILIGDPLYQPFKVPVEKQWKQRESISPALAPYVAIRQMHLLEAAGKRDEALAIGQKELRRDPSVPLVLAMARTQLNPPKPKSAETPDAAAVAAGKKAAARTLAVLTLFNSIRTEDVLLFAEGADLLRQADDAKNGLVLIQRILADQELSKPMRIGLLKQGQVIARAAMDFRQVASWDAEHRELTAPPPPPPAPPAPPQPASPAPAATAPKK